VVTKRRSLVTGPAWDRVSRHRTERRLAGAAAGILVDQLAGDPPLRAAHPVALLGRALEGIEGRTYRPTRAAGAVHAAAGVAFGAVAGRALRSTTAATAACVAGRMLTEVATDIAGHLEQGELAAARRALPALAGRDPDVLDAAGIARAVVESVAENTVDAIVAPAFWAAVAGPAGVGAHKAVSTLDSMVGHRSERYREFGWASARLDDVAAYVPARLTALLVAAVRPRRATAVWRAVRCDAPAHPSPNAGVAEAAFAGALGVTVGGPTDYGDRVDIRPPLGDGPAPTVVDIARATALSRDVSLAFAAALTVAAATTAAARHRRTGGR
jgi:adenosylcobinamide-phosphate synthase